MPRHCWWVDRYNSNILKESLIISSKVTNSHSCWPRNFILMVYALVTKKAIFRVKPTIDFSGKEKVKIVKAKIFTYTCL